MSGVDAEARREARRRKILENSERRLQRITGVQQRKASYEIEGYRSTQSIEDENSVENHLPNGNFPGTEFTNSNHVSPQVEAIYRNSLFSSSFQSQPSVSSIDHTSFTRTYKIHVIVGLACSLNVLLFFYQGYDFLLLNKIFIPLLCFEAIYLFYNQKSDASDEIIKISRLFIKNVPPHYLSLIIKYFTLAATITRDLMIYFFVFICVWFIFNVLHGIFFF